MRTKDVLILLSPVLLVIRARGGARAGGREPGRRRGRRGNPADRKSVV